MRPLLPASQADGVYPPEFPPLHPGHCGRRGHGTAHYGRETRSDDTGLCHETSDDHDDDDCHHCVSGSFSAVRV